MKPIRVGVVGTGFIGQVHLEILKEIEGVEIVGIVEPVESRAKEVAQKYGAKPLSKVEELKEVGADAVYITSPNRTHFEVAMQAIEVRLNVFCEKPMTISLEDAKALEKAVKEHGIVFQVGHNRRFAYVYKFMKDLIDSGEITPYSFQIKMNRGELLNPPWVSDVSYTGGFLFESTLHLFDMMRFLFGDVAELFVLGKKSVYKDFDDWAIAVKMKNGIIGTFTSCAHASWMIPFERVEVYGEHVMLANDEMEKVYYSKGLDKEVEVHDYMKVDFKEKWGYVEEDHAFIEAVREGKTPKVTVADGVKAIEIVDACYRAVKGEGPHIVL